MRAYVLSCYGDRQIHTPNLDRIAEEGVLFENAFSIWPVCSPYRGMLLTGLYPMRNGVTSNDTAMRGDVPTIATVCKDNGYATGYIGKWHLDWKRATFVKKDRRRGFDFWASQNCGHQYFDAVYCTDSHEKKVFPGYEPKGQAKMAASYIQEHREKPFCLFLSWGPPHDPYIGPDEYMKMFPPEALKMRPNYSETETVEKLLAGDPNLPLDVMQMNINDVYYWRIVADRVAHPNGPWQGDVQRFITSDLDNLDRFENGLAGNWAGTGGATIAIDPNVNTTGDANSLIMDYNSLPTGASTATMTLAYANRNWTAATGRRSIRVIVKGRSTNEVDDVYITSTDGSGTSDKVGPIAAAQDINRPEFKGWINFDVRMMPWADFMEK
jgi:hypothetical protein